MSSDVIDLCQMATDRIDYRGEREVQMVLHKFVDDVTGWVTVVMLSEQDGLVTYWTNRGSRRNDLQPKVKKLPRHMWNKIIQGGN